MVFSTGCREISAPSRGTPPHPPYSLTLVLARLFLTLSFLSPLPSGSISPSLKCTLPEVLPSQLEALAAPCNGFISASWNKITEDLPPQPLPPTPWYLHQIKGPIYKFCVTICNSNFYFVIIHFIKWNFIHSRTERIQRIIRLLAAIYRLLGLGFFPKYIWKVNHESSFFHFATFQG